MPPRNSGRVLSTLQPAPPAAPPGSPLELWIWLVVGAVLVVAAGFALTSRR